MCYIIMYAIYLHLQFNFIIIIIIEIGLVRPGLAGHWLHWAVPKCTRPLRTPYGAHRLLGSRARGWSVTSQLEVYHPSFEGQVAVP